MNTGFNISTDSGLTHSGFNTVGNNVSGFNNSASGAVGALPPLGVNGNISGFNNTAVGATNPAGYLSPADCRASSTAPAAPTTPRLALS